MGKKQHGKDRMFKTKQSRRPNGGGAISKEVGTSFKRLPSIVAYEDHGCDCGIDSCRTLDIALRELHDRSVVSSDILMDT